MRSRRHVIPVCSSLLTLILVLSTLLFLMLAALSCSKTEDLGARTVPDSATATYAVNAPPPPLPVPIGDAREEAALTGNASAQKVAFGDMAYGSGVAAPVVAAAPPMNTEEYGRIVENAFLRVVDNPLSTFSIDVDRASYSNVRRFLASGRMPVRDAVRIEEMVNYFTYDYPEPSGAEPFSVTTEIAACPWNAKNRLLLVGLQGKHVKTEDLPPNNLVFLVDVSGSMNEPSKLPLLKQSFGLLVDQLRPQDRVAIVVYAGSAGLVLPSTSGENKREILGALEQLQAGGSTAGGEGILLAYKTAKENYIKGGNNRVILATDGDFNVGVSSDGELERLIEEKRRENISLSVLGFGTGNIKDSKMELLADKGNGNYAYIDDLSEARKTLVTEMGGTLLTIAKDVKLQIEFNPARVLAYRLIGYENRVLAKEDFHDDAKDAGEMGAGHSVTALYELVPPDGDTKLANVDGLKYQTTAISSAAKSSPELLTLKLRYKPPTSDSSILKTQPVLDSRGAFESASANLRFAAAVAEFGMLLRDSKLKGDASYDEVKQIALAAIGKDPEGYRRDFVTLVDQARALAPAEVASR